MKFRLFYLLLICVPLFSNDISKENKPLTVRVLLCKLKPDALIEVTGRFNLYNPKTDALIVHSAKSKRSKLTTKETGLQWGEVFPDTFELRIVPHEPGATILVNGIQYRGCMEIYSIGGTINIVNEIDTENYLKSILGPKTENFVCKEALDALVITERTNLYYQIQKDAYATWQVEADKVGYRGEAAARHNPSLQKAVDRTKHLIMNYKNQPFATSWGLDHAGNTVHFSSVFRKNASAPPGVTHLPSLDHREKAQWSATLTQKQLTPLVKLKTIEKVGLFKAEKSQKVYGVRFIGNNAYIDIDFSCLQKILGETTLQSNDFDINLKGNKIVFKGYGKGPGVGLCMHSAAIMAGHKESTEKILIRHFPNTKLVHAEQEAGKPDVPSHIWN